MPRLYIITGSPPFATSVARYLRYTRGFNPTCLVLSLEPLHSPHDRNLWVLQTFRCIADALEGENHDGQDVRALRNAIALIDLCDRDLEGLEQLDPLATNMGWASVVAMLILAFPEIHWVFVTPYRPSDTAFSSCFQQAHILRGGKSLSEILKLHHEKFTPLFDPTNLRHTIREQIRRESNKPVAPYVPCRRKVAAAIDEEEAYAYFNAYTAYRFGFRSHVVTSYNMMKRLFESSSNIPHDQNPQLTFEDVYLNFPDKDPSIRLSDLKERDVRFSRLRHAKYRIVLTVGHKRTADPARWGSNQDHLRNLRVNGQWNKILYKPFSGIFDLWKRSGLQRKKLGGRKRGIAEGFEWPPPKTASAEPEGSHSAPGRLLEVADRLIQRAEYLLQKAASVPEALHGALVAMEAQELLGNRTPTTSLEALALKHQLEVTAECLFYGVEYNFDVKTRFKDLRKEVRAIGEWFHPRIRRRSERSARSSIISHLVLRFREFNQFDEEHACLQEARRLQRSWNPFQWYIDRLLGSLTWFAVAILAWIVGFSVFFWWAEANLQGGFWQWPQWLIYSAITFFSLGIPESGAIIPRLNTLPNNMFLTGVVAEVVVGFVHLGIFISHLYSLMARR